MTPEQKQAKERAEVILAFAEGKKVECSGTGQPKIWEPVWNWTSCDYRIAPEPKVVPFTWEDREMLRGKWVRMKKEHGNEKLLTSISDYGVETDNRIYTYAEAFEELEFTDGKPFGKEVSQ